MFAPDPDRRPAVPLFLALVLILTTGLCLAAKTGVKVAARHGTRIAKVAPAPAATPSASGPVLNLALNRPFTLNGETLPGWDGLVDGIKDSDDPPACFATDNSAKFPKNAVIDLGCLCDISKIAVYNSANGNTREVIVSLSKDAKTYDVVRDYVFPNGKFQPLLHSFTARKARFVKLIFKDSWHKGLGGDNILYLREVEVFGKRLEKADSGSVWSYLATAPTLRRSPSWHVLRRYLKEVNRQARVAVLTDAKPEALLGPDGWLSRSLSDAGRSVSPTGLKLVAYSTATDGPAALTALEATLDHEPPDLLVVDYSVAPDEPLGADADHTIAACSKAGAAVLMILPAPSQEGQADPAKFRQLHRRLLAVASNAGALVIDGGAVLARSAKPSSLISAKGLTHEGANLLAEALGAALAK